VSRLPTFDAPFTVTVRFDGQRAFVAAEGELDLATVGALRSAFDELRGIGWPSIVADLRGLTFIDSQGLSLLVRLDLDAKEDGWRFAILDGSPAVRRLLEVARLTTYFDYAEAPPTDADGPGATRSPLKRLRDLTLRRGM
jgi:anti-anti-sigma factor